MLAAQRGHHRVLAVLVAAGASLNVAAKYGLSALMLAVVNLHAESAALLARAGADRTLRGSGAPGFSGKTAHDLAVERGMVELSAELKPGSEP
jgi:ankyrin repeat protein